MKKNRRTSSPKVRTTSKSNIEHRLSKTEFFLRVNRKAIHTLKLNSPLIQLYSDTHREVSELITGMCTVIVSGLGSYERHEDIFKKETKKAYIKSMKDHKTEFENRQRNWCQRFRDKILGPIPYDINTYETNIATIEHVQDEALKATPTYKDFIFNGVIDKNLIEDMIPPGFEVSFKYEMVDYSNNQTFDVMLLSAIDSTTVSKTRSRVEISFTLKSKANPELALGELAEWFKVKLDIVKELKVAQAKLLASLKHSEYKNKTTRPITKKDDAIVYNILRKLA